MEDELRSFVGSGEKIYFEGKPNKKCFLLESIFNPLLPFSIMWALFDSMFIGVSMQAGAPKEFAGFISIFMLFHLMPVWMYLGGVIFSVKNYKNTSYIVTDRAIYISKGVFSKHIETKPFAELSHINLHRGVFDQMCGVGDVIATTNQRDSEGRTKSITISSISEYTDVYNMVKKLQTDIYSDVMYPNAKRPAENPGYNTEYKGM